MNMSNEIQELIDETDYWDAEILDLKVSYFGDEVEMIIDNDEELVGEYVFHLVTRYFMKQMLIKERLLR